VSTSAATIVEVFTPPTTAGETRCCRPLSATAQTTGNPIEQFEAQLERKTWMRGSDRRQTDRIAGSAPFDVVARLDAQLLGQGLGNRHLIFARDLGHVLTISRTSSLPESPDDYASGRSIYVVVQSCSAPLNVPAAVATEHPVDESLSESTAILIVVVAAFAVNNR